MTTRLGLLGLDSSHTEDFLKHFNIEGRHNDVYVTAIGDGDAARMAQLAKACPGLECAPSPEALIAAVDGVIVGHRDGALHRAAAVASLRAGRPTFVDKPLANAFADAEAIVATATATGTPLLSGSALRWQAETLRLKAVLAAIDGAFELLVYGTWYPQSEYGGAIFYAIHAIELLQELLGPDHGPVAAVPGAGTAVQFRAGRANVTLEFRPPGPTDSTDFGVAFKVGGVPFTQPIVLGEDYMAPVCDRIADMLRSGRSCLSPDELLAPIRLMTAVESLLLPATRP